MRIKLAVAFLIFGVAEAFSADGNVKGSPDLSGQEDTLNNYLKHNDSALLVSVYKTEWIPPSEGLPKGRLQTFCKIVRVYKGKFKIGEKLSYVDLVEEVPKWLKAFTTAQESELRYLVVDSKEAFRKYDRYDLSVGSQWTFSFDDEVFSALFEAKLGTASRH